MLATEASGDTSPPKRVTAFRERPSIHFDAAGVFMTLLLG
jgi:hypothetical protein